MQENMGKMLSKLEEENLMAIEFLKTNKDKIIYNLSHGIWQFAEPKNEQAKSLERNIEAGVGGGHSGASYGRAILFCVGKAEKELGYTIQKEERGEGTDDIVVTLTPSGTN